MTARMMRLGVVLLCALMTTSFALGPALRSRGGLTAMRSSSVASPADAQMQSSSIVSPAGARTPAEWHLLRRKELLRLHPEVEELFGVEPTSLPLLMTTNAMHAACAVASGHLLASPDTFGLALFLPLCYAGSFLSVAQFSLLHDLIHGGVVRENKIAWLRALSVPSFFGYYLYMRHGHLSHHRAMGEHTYADVFTSNRTTFEDGDVMFAQHRQVLDERAPWLRREPRGWRDNAWGNMAVYTSTVLIERLVLFGVDKYTALTGFNPFFANKPQAFHDDNARASRVQTATHLALFFAAGPGALVYLWATECLWTLPIHPVSAMFYTNHDPTTRDDGTTQPSCSVYAGGWFDKLCFNTNYHVEHHDLPEVPYSRLPRLREMAPEFYDPLKSYDDVPKAIYDAFDGPRVYAGADDFAATARVERAGPVQYKENPLWRLLFDLKV